MKKAELLVTPKNVEHIRELIQAGADAFLVGEQYFGLRLAGEFTLDENQPSTKLVKEHNKKKNIKIGILPGTEIEPLNSRIRVIKIVMISICINGSPTTQK